MATPFQAALARIGFTIPQLGSMATQDIRNLDDIAMLTKENLRDIGKRIYDEGNVDFPILLTQKLIVIHFWRRTRINSGQQANVADINNQFIITQSEAYQLYNEKKSKRITETVVKPEKFLQPSKWRVFHDSVQAYLQGVNGSTNIPLSYIICQNATPTPVATYANEMEARIANAPLNGMAYNTNNHAVHSIILSLVLDGPGYAYIR